MKKITLLLAGLFLLAGTSFGSEPMQIAVSIAPQTWFVKRIGGENVRVVVLVPTGANPHTYEPKPSQLAAMARAEAWLTMGMEFEHAWEERLLSAKPDLAVIPMDADIEKMPMAEHGHHHGEEPHGGEHGEEHHAEKGHDMHGEHEDHAHHTEHAEHGEEHELLDPHIWTAPDNARILAANVAAALSGLDPARAHIYRGNLAEVNREIDAMVSRIEQALAGLPENRRAFMVFHPSWGYFARQFGLTQIAIEVEGKEPSPMELAGIIKQARDTGVTTLFVQPQMSTRAAGVVAKAIGANLVEADPLSADWDANLLKVAKAFSQAVR